MEGRDEVSAVRRRRVVGVMGSGRRAWAERADVVGRTLAGLGVHLLTGGGGGAMAAVSRAFAETPGREGLVLGVLPATADDPAASPPGYPNRWVEVAVRTHLPWSGRRGTEPLSRNHVNVLTADAVVVLPGSEGTRSEVELARRYGRPLVAFLDEDEMPGLPAEVPQTTDRVRLREILVAALR